MPAEKISIPFGVGSIHEEELVPIVLNDLNKDEAVIQKYYETAVLSGDIESADAIYRDAKKKKLYLPNPNRYDYLGMTLIHHLATRHASFNPDRVEAENLRKAAELIVKKHGADVNIPTRPREAPNSTGVRPGFFKRSVSDSYGPKGINIRKEISEGTPLHISNAFGDEVFARFLRKNLRAKPNVKVVYWKPRGTIKS